jgi:hypothetical protein
VEGFQGTNGLAIDDDSVYAVGLFSFNVYEFDLENGLPVGELVSAEGGSLYFPGDLLVDPQGSLLVSSLGNDNPANELPLAPGYIGKYDLQTGEPIDPLFISDAGGLVQPSAMLLLAPALMPGDADQDLDFDQFDLIKVQIAAKYLTSEPATWGEGDWDGAPGGRPGNPPPGDGQFDTQDIVAALNAGKYGTGPYAAATSATSGSVFESAMGGHRGRLAMGNTVEVESGHEPLPTGPTTDGPAVDGPPSPPGLGIHAPSAYVPVPEPATNLLLLAGVLIGWIARRKWAGPGGDSLKSAVPGRHPKQFPRR